ncbi:hypothetical protein [Cohnella luojiensis]|uniref:DUF4376 domain-containing protein n=1 Tax=Cohnella luojiensis TaxID=652876 RepID=A0A4Y8M7P2_9BACL|nr:hypothetical protein [Cohnella luojiensis]TFE30845.1 hypothetical protein E2980_03450 [Cohnella luojiensis]
MDGYKHYIRINEAGIIVHGFSSAFEEPREGDILVESDAGRHFNFMLIDGQGNSIYKWDGTQMVERTADEIYPLSYWKQKKIGIFTSQRDLEVQAGFLTNAVASTPNIQMGYDPVDKNNYQSLATMLNLDPTISSVPFLTGIGMVTFTRDEFIQVIKDAYNHESSLVYKCLTLKAQIEAAADKQSLDSIVW